MLRMLGGWVCGLKSECPSRWAFLSSPTVCSRSWHVDGASVGPWLSDFQLGRFRQGHVPLSCGIFHAFPAQRWEELPTGTVHSSHTYLIAIHPSPAWTRLTSRAFQSIDVESWILLGKKKYYFHLQPLEGFESASWFYYCQQTDLKTKTVNFSLMGWKYAKMKARPTTSSETHIPGSRWQMFAIWSTGKSRVEEPCSDFTVMHPSIPAPSPSHVSNRGSTIPTRSPIFCVFS